MYYVKFRIWVTGELCYSLEYNVDALNVKWKNHLSKETIMKRKRKAFVKVFIKLSWFLLISGLGLILACRLWSQIRVSSLGRDILCSSQNHITTNPINKSCKEIESEDHSFIISENCTTHNHQYKFAFM